MYVYIRTGVATVLGFRTYIYVRKSERVNVSNQVANLSLKCVVCRADPGNLWVPTFIHMPVHQGRVATVPCRLSDPEATVKLVKAPRKLMSMEDLTYDPRTGFHILYLNYAYSGMFYCVATLGNRTNTVTAILIYKGKCMYGKNK